jgi:hypothetical protein
LNIYEPERFGFVEKFDSALADRWSTFSRSFLTFNLELKKRREVAWLVIVDLAMASEIRKERYLIPLHNLKSVGDIWVDIYKY